MSLSREEIIRMAREAGLSVNHVAEPPKPYDQIAGYGDALERLFNAAYAAGAAAEREQCAMVCDERALLSFDNSDEQCEAQDCAAAIRARGNGGEK